jgi:replicative DNA helicase
MKFSAHVFRLKRLARILSRDRKIPLSKALDRIALKEGYANWSLLMTRVSLNKPARALYGQLKAGDMVLLGARPGQGKTLMSLELIIETIMQGSQGAFFTLDYTSKDLQELLQLIGRDLTNCDNHIQFDRSDQICSDYIVGRLATIPRGSIVVVDYLQLLDQKRDNPDLADQVNTLKIFAEENGLIIVFISQIDRSFDHSTKPFPELADVRLPNPVDLSVFSKVCFLNNGEIRISGSA